MSDKIEKIINDIVNKYPYEESKLLFKSELEYLVEQAIKDIPNQIE